MPFFFDALCQDGPWRNGHESPAYSANLARLQFIVRSLRLNVSVDANSLHGAAKPNRPLVSRLGATQPRSGPTHH